MKKRIFLLIICITFSLSFSVATNLKPILQLCPNISFGTREVTGLVDASKAVSAYKDYADKPHFLDIGFQLSSRYMEFVCIASLHQKFDVLSTADGNGYLWFQPKASLSFDDNAPRIGYAEVRYKGFLGSIGRRPLKWGPGTYDLGVSDISPYYDGLWLQYRYDADYGSWWYQFLGSSFGGMYVSDASPVNKGMFAHRIGFENHFVRATVSELAMSYSATSAALTWIPFAVWQATAHESSNVLLEATCEGLYGPARMYGSFILSDSQIIGSLRKDPASFGTMGGLEWHFFDGNEVEVQRSYELKENTFRPTQGGLSAGFECYYTSNYLYCGKDTSGSFTSPLKQFAFAGALYGDALAYYIGFPYGPGSLLCNAFATYEGHSLKVSGSVGVLLKDGATASLSYDEGTLDEFSLVGSDIRLLLSCDGIWQYNNAIALCARLNSDINISQKSADFTAFVCASFQWSPSVTL